MAEYIDIARIDDWNDLSIIDDDGYAINVYDVGELPRADVVEREKIDKAISEIMDIDWHKIIWNYEDVEIGFKSEVEKILKRNIGESK